MIRVLLESNKYAPKYKTLEDLLNHNCTRKDVLDYLEIPVKDSKYSYFTHATRNGNSGINSILSSGIKLSNGKLWACSGEVRDTDLPYVVFRIPHDELDEYLSHTGIDRDHKGSQEYVEYVFTKAIPAKYIVKSVKLVKDSTGFSISEKLLAEHALENPNDPDQKYLPAPWTKLFKL